MLALTMLDRSEEALAVARTWNPELLTEEPTVSDNNHDVAEGALFALARLGDKPGSDRLAAALRAHIDRDHGNESPGQVAVRMAIIAAAAGDSQRAVALFQNAVDEGWLGTAEWAWKLTESEYLGDAVSSPEVISLQAEIDTGMGEQREKVRQQLAELGAGARF